MDSREHTSQPRILLLEPYAEIRSLLSLSLQRAGYVVQQAQQSRQAARCLQRQRFACLIVGSPVQYKRGGQQKLFLEYLAELELIPCTIVITAHVEDHRILTLASSLGAHAVFAKPFAVAELLRAVESCVSGKSLERRWFGFRQSSVPSEKQSLAG